MLNFQFVCNKVSRFNCNINDVLSSQQHRLEADHRSPKEGNLLGSTLFRIPK